MELLAHQPLIAQLMAQAPEETHGEMRRQIADDLAARLPPELR